MKKIINVVFYNYFEGNTEKREACVFYRDGSVDKVDYEGGINACEEIVKERNITSKDVFRQMVNDEIVYVMTKEELKAKFDLFVNKELIDREMIDDVVSEAMPKQKVMTKADDIKNDNEENLNNVKTSATSSMASKLKSKTEDEDEFEEDYEDDYEDEDDYEEEDEDDYEDEHEYDDDLVIENTTKKVDTAREVDEFDSDDYDDEYDDDFDEEIEDNSVNEEEKPSRIKGFFSKQLNKFRKAGAGIRGLIVGLALTTGLGSAAGFALKGSKTGQMISNLNTVEAAELDDNYAINLENASMISGIPTLKSVGDLKTGNNDDYDDYTYEELLEVTDNKTQKTAMTNLGTTLFGFNGDFADAYVEEGKDIRAALKVEEAEALQVAYNDYSKDELKAIFNGSEVRADKMSMDYKAASLQLMGAYTIETSKNPVDMSYLLETQEGKDFYNKYHTMYLEAKEATGQDKLDKVNAFYAEVKKDFPITDDVRTEGIAHADAYATLEAYKLSVTPMIAAAEMQFQNLDVDYTLNDTQIDFINDIGLCNYADDTFERLETITLSADEDKTNPTELQYRNSLIKALEAENHYVIDDAHRELSKLDSFQLAVNRHSGEFGNGNGYYIPTTIGGGETTTTTTSTKEWTESETTYRTETTVEEREIPADEKEKIDEKIEEENEDAKEEAEEEAEEERKRQQDEEDKKAKEIQEEIEEDEKDMQDKIDDANDKIKDNDKDDDKSNDDPVNEKDFGDHNVDFYDDYSDEDGNLDDSVKDITTDPTGDETGKDLPDPNETGAIFDSKVVKSDWNLDPTKPINHDTDFRLVDGDWNLDPTKPIDRDKPVDDTPTDGDVYTEYPEDTPTYDEDGNIVETKEEDHSEKYYDEYGNVYDSYEDFINAYVEYQASNTATETDAKQYTK